MAKIKKSGKNDKGSDNNDAKPVKKGWGGPLLLLILTISAAVTILLLSARVRQKALGLFANLKNAAAAAMSDSTQSSNRAWGGGSDATLRFYNSLAAKFAEMELRDTDYSMQLFPAKDSMDIKAAVPRGRPTEWIIWELSSVAAGTPFKVEDCVCAPQTQATCEITFKSANPKHPKIVLNVRRSNRYFSNTAQMAILIEDFGFEANQTTVEYLSFPEPLTVSLAPAQKLAAWTAQIADEYKKEIALLLPMEPLPPQIAGKYKQYTITIHASEENIRGIISQAAAAIPNFSGISTFHGTKTMEDSRVMGIILSETNRRKAYFVYTDASRKSVVPQLVKEMKTPSHPIQVSISAEHTAEQARERLRRGAATAERTGKALVRASPSPAFIQVLKEETGALKSNGIRLVYVSELVK